MKFTSNIAGILLLAIYLILTGVMILVPSVAIPAIVMGILALCSRHFPNYRTIIYSCSRIPASGWH